MANLGYIQITRQCNQRCRFCSNPETDYHLDSDQGRAKVDSLVDLGYYGVIFTGGEPTLCDLLPELLVYARGRGLHTRIITNGQMLSDPKYLDNLLAAGLNHVHISLHTHRADLQDFLTDNPNSLLRVVQALRNLKGKGITVDINTTINRYNADHLDAIVRWVVDEFVTVNHFVWNNLDTSMGRVAQYPDAIHRLSDMEVSLHRAMTFLASTGRTFRVEKVPLCYMTEFAHCSTETRKIVKGEERIVHFLDDKGIVRQTKWDHVKADACQACTLSPVCAGVFDPAGTADFDELYPVFVSCDNVRRAVLIDEN